MELYPTGFLAMAVWAAVALRRPDLGLVVVTVLMPFGMLAVMRLPIGGMTPLAAHVAAALSVSVAAGVVAARSLRRPASLPAPTATIPLLLLLAYAGVVTAFMPHFFAGEFLAFTFAREVRGVYIDPRHPGIVVPVGPSSANLSQTAYLILTAAFFLYAVAVLRRRGPGLGVFAIRIAAALNVVLGVLDALALDVLLEPLRTAAYSLLNEHTIAGIPRIIGGFPEASSFGGFSTTMAAFLLVYGLASGRTFDLALGAVNAALAALGLSSTGFLGLFALGAAMAVQSGRLLVARLPRRTVLSLAMALCAGGAVVVFVAGATPLGVVAAEMIDQLVFSKTESESALERGASAAYGIQAFVETSGLGIGIGTLRANGLLPTILSSVGLPGLALFVWYVVAALLVGPTPDNRESRAVLRAAQVTGLVHLVMMGASSFSIDPGLLFVMVAAMALAARSETVEPQPAAPGMRAGRPA